MAPSANKSIDKPGNTKGGCITVPLTSCLTGLDESVLQIKTKIVSSHTADSKIVKQEVNGTVILPPLVIPGRANDVPWGDICSTVELMAFELKAFRTGEVAPKFNVQSYDETKTLKTILRIS
jgi:hypothetical protein